MLEVVLHTSGGTLIFNGYTHEEFVDLFFLRSTMTREIGWSSCPKSGPVPRDPARKGREAEISRRKRSAIWRISASNNREVER